MILYRERGPWSLAAAFGVGVLLELVELPRSERQNEDQKVKDESLRRKN
jgi:hypothetical protein